MKYLFLSIPNFCGSTLVHNIISTSPNVALLQDLSLENRYFIEGNYIPMDESYGEHIAAQTYELVDNESYHSIFANIEDRLSDKALHDWKHNKFRWDNCWNKHNPTAEIRLQKTPADIFRVSMMSDYFENLHWIVSVRNPYLHAESILRKNPNVKFDKMCYHVIRCLEIQKENAAYLGNKALVTTYEQITGDPAAFKEKLLEWMPELDDVNIDRDFVIKKNWSGIKNYNLHRLKKLDNEHRAALTDYFKNHLDILMHWGYDLL